MTFEIQIKGKPFTKWESARVSRSIDSNCGSFTFTNSSLLPSQLPIRAGDPVVVLVNGESVVNGFVDEISASGSVSSHTISVSGRDNVSDLIDSSLPDSVKTLSGNKTIKELAEMVISSLGANIKVIDTSNVSTKITEEEISGSTSDKCIDFLMDYASKFQVYLISDGKGRLEIFRPGKSKATSPLLHLKDERINNVKSWSVSQNYQSRYNKYICRSQDDFGFDVSADYGESGTARTGTVTDKNIREGRFLEIIAEESLDDSKCLERAKEEANLRRARATVYSATVAGVTQSDGSNWTLGDIINVQDDFSGLNGDYLIRDIEYSVSSMDGSNTVITVAPIDAYTVQATQTSADKRKSAGSSQLASDEAEKSNKNVRPTSQQQTKDKALERRKRILFGGEQQESEIDRRKKILLGG